MKIQPIYNNTLFKKGLEFAADNGALFVATTSLALSSIARPLAIMATPNTNKENKKYAAAKSLASSAAGYALMLCASLPLAKSIKQIDKNPSKYLKEQTINALKESDKTLTKSSKYKFATQLFKLGLGFVIAVPKSILTCALTPNIKQKVFNKNNNTSRTSDLQTSKAPSFTGLSNQIGKIIDKPLTQKLADKYHNTNFPLHIMAITDTLATGAFITQTAKSKKIEDDRKKALMYNAGISTALCIGGSYIINSATKSSTEKFIEKFKQANINSPKLDKYIEGIKIVKPALIMGSMYYIAIPLISTFLADRFEQKIES